MPNASKDNSPEDSRQNLSWNRYYGAVLVALLLYMGLILFIQNYYS
jgi:hypothetical protein